MRLLTRLWLSHLAPLVVVLLAMILMLVALSRITAALHGLDRAELRELRQEGELHRAAWTLDVSMRHGEEDCQSRRSVGTVRERMRSNAATIIQTLDRTPPLTRQMNVVIEGYVEVANEILAEDDVCDGLLSERLGARRGQLDEDLTNLWMARLDELHGQVAEKKEEARRTGMTALVVGVVATASSAIFAMVLAARFTRVINQPLRSLAKSAQRVGRGDFGTPVAASGPREFVELARELENMRLKLAELEALKQGFLASVSHELRTPLSKIREALALLQDGVLGPVEAGQAEVLTIARNACEREIRMVTTLLDLSRLRAGSPLRPRAGVSIDDVIGRAVQEEGSDAQARGVEVRFVSSGPAPSTRLDPVLLERAIANLVRNAVSVSKSGQVVVVERNTRSVSGPRGSHSVFEIRVSDEGPGVPKEIRDSIFDVFVTQPVPNSEKGLGFGLGLALAREIARAHQGELGLDPPSGHGAVFVLRLPVDPPQPPRSEPDDLV